MSESHHTTQLNMFLFGLEMCKYCMFCLPALAFDVVKLSIGNGNLNLFFHILLNFFQISLESCHFKTVEAKQLDWMWDNAAGRAFFNKMPTRLTEV